MLVLCARFADVLHAASAARRSKVRIVQDAIKHLPSARARKRSKHLGAELLTRNRHGGDFLVWQRYLTESIGLCTIGL
ncbi:MAG: hypothetical protein Greene071421_283 [Parcubacteria group bacterium Greene0714_21]|nr:MAG: hypothetical protein Greene101447_419 [Parcubacteria group bacterium Greene1014_47]TSD04447.1 MAG: hypothetical protein Greene071421_283 [Parcubacteria group bacterium Greene0714_21]